MHTCTHIFIKLAVVHNKTLKWTLFHFTVCYSLLDLKGIGGIEIGIACKEFDLEMLIILYKLNWFESGVGFHGIWIAECSSGIGSRSEWEEMIATRHQKWWCGHINTGPNTLKMPVSAIVYLVEIRSEHCLK